MKKKKPRRERGLGSRRKRAPSSDGREMNLPRRTRSNISADGSAGGRGREGASFDRVTHLAHDGEAAEADAGLFLVCHGVHAEACGSEAGGRVTRDAGAPSAARSSEGRADIICHARRDVGGGVTAGASRVRAPPGALASRQARAPVTLAVRLERSFAGWRRRRKEGPERTGAAERVAAPNINEIPWLWLERTAWLSVRRRRRRGWARRGGREGGDGVRDAGRARRFASRDARGRRVPRC